MRLGSLDKLEAGKLRGCYCSLYKCKLHSATLSCKKHAKKQTGEEIAESLKDVCEEYEISLDHVVGLVTDSAANMNLIGEFKNYK